MRNSIVPPAAGPEAVAHLNPLSTIGTNAGAASSLNAAVLRS
jgi:hypothetical protein